MRSPQLVVVTTALVTLLLACAPGGNAAPTAPSPQSAAGSVSAPDPSAIASAPSPTVLVPRTETGILTGPGVSDQTISLGVIADADRGFTAGIRIWQEAVNKGGGICGRHIELNQSASADAYADLARENLGLLTLTSDEHTVTLASRARADGIVILTPHATTHELTGGVIPLGATSDYHVINALAYLSGSGGLSAGTTIGLYRDTSHTAADISRGLRWWAQEHHVRLTVAERGQQPPQTDVIIVVLPAAEVAQVLADRPTATVVTTLEGYQPELIPPAQAQRLLIMSATPVNGAEHPAVGPLNQAAAAGRAGPQLFVGYATAQMWGRTLTKMCQQAELTRDGALRALAAGAAPPESLFGATNPAQVLQSQRPATIASAMARADPANHTGLTGLTVLQVSAQASKYHG